MFVNTLMKNSFFAFVIRFITLFLVLYLLTYLVIGLSTPQNRYVHFIDRYMNFPDWLRYFLMNGAQTLLSLFGYSTSVEPGFLLRLEGGRGVIVSYGCAGYGILSFWLAYSFAAKLNILQKFIWAFGGFLGICLINIIRIALFLLAINKGWPMPLGLDHHSWFNILAYLLIFIMIYFFNRQDAKS